MIKILLPLILIAVIVSGCTTQTALVTGLACKPPVVIMKKSDPLSQVTSGTMRDMYNTMLQDAEQFNELRDKHSNLVDWVDIHCDK